jgi:hypothetical protein
MHVRGFLPGKQTSVSLRLPYLCATSLWVGLQLSWTDSVSGAYYSAAGLFDNSNLEASMVAKGEDAHVTTSAWLVVCFLYQPSPLLPPPPPPPSPTQAPPPSSDPLSSESH